jgi:transposase
VQTRELGSVLVLQALWKRLGLQEELLELCGKKGLSAPYERALFAMVANRLCEPASKLGLWDRWLPTVHLPCCQQVKLAQFYEAMDLLAKHAAELERAAFWRLADLFNLEVDLLFYDTTSVSLCIDYEDSEGDDAEQALRRWGRNKEGGSSIQVVVALAVTRDGLPVRSWVFPGNTADVSTVKKVRADLREWKLGRCLFVADCGMNSEENRKELARACGKYLLAVRADEKEVAEEVLTRSGRYQHVSDNLRVKEVVVGDGEMRRRYLLCFNPKEAERQKRHREEVLAEIREELSQHRSLETRAKWTAMMRASKRTGPYLSVGAAGTLYIDPERVARAEKLDGKWVLMTNDDSLSAEEAATGYKALAVIERCFRGLKSAQIDMRPMYHWLGRRIEAHVKICVLALLLQRVAERECNEPWLRLRTELRNLQATEIRSSTHRLFRRNEISEGVAKILKALKIPAPKPILGID